MIVFLLFIVAVCFGFGLWMLASINNVLQTISIDISRIAFKSRMSERLRSAVVANKQADRAAHPKDCSEDM